MADLSQHTAQLLTTAAVVGLASISVYLILFMPTFAVKSLHLPGYAGYLGGMISGVVTLVGVPFVGTLADRVGAARVMRATAVAASCSHIRCSPSCWTTPAWRR